MTQLSLASTVCHTPNPVAADVAGETVLMSLERSRCYGLGGIGSEIWSKLESPVRVGDLVFGSRERGRGDGGGGRGRGMGRRLDPRVGGGAGVAELGGGPGPPP